MAKRRRTLALVKAFQVQKKEEPWTPLGVLEEFVADVRSGKLHPQKVMIFYVEPDADGRLRPHYWCQQVSIAEQMAYGELIKALALEDWKS